MKTIVIRCVAPERRDALEEAARLALSFISVGMGPEFPSFQCNKHLELHLSSLALVEGCHLPDTAQELLEALQAFGVSVRKVKAKNDSATEEWKQWWKTLDVAVDRDFDVELEIR